MGSAVVFMNLYSFVSKSVVASKYLVIFFKTGRMLALRSCVY